MEEIDTITRDEPVELPPETAKDLEPSKPNTSPIKQVVQRPHEISALAIMGVFFLGLVAFLYFARAFCLPLVLALLFSFLLKPVVRSMGRVHVPSSIGAALVLAVVLGILGSGVSQVREPA